MNYNVALHSHFESNTTEGTIDISTDEAIAILRNIGYTAVSGSATVCLDCDLGSRIHLDEIRYYYTSTIASSGTIASNLEFWAKDDSVDTYVSLATMVGPSYYYATASGTSILAPRYIRIKQYTTASGHINGFEAYNDDETVDFGTDGTRTEENFDMALLDALTEIREVPIYNSGDRLSDAYAMLEYKNDFTDEVFSVAPSSEGPWKTPTDNVLENDETWETDRGFQIVLDADGVLSVEPSKTYGTYTTKLFSASEDTTFSHLVLQYSDEVLPRYVAFQDAFNDSLASPSLWPDRSGSWSFTTGYMRSISDNGYSQTDQIYLGYDWQITYRWYFSSNSDNQQGQTRFYSYPSSSLNFYTQSRRESGNGWYHRFIVNGSTKYNSGWSYTNGWRWVKIRRFFTTLYFKWWWDGDPEPASWQWSGPADNYDHTYIIMAKNNSVSDYTYWDDFYVEANYTVSGTQTSFPKIAVDEEDTQVTLEVRSSNQKPKNYDTYTSCINSGSTIILREYLKDDDSTLWSSGDLTQQGRHQSEDGWDDTDARIAIDKYTNRRAAIFKWHDTHDYVYDIMNISIVEPDESITTKILTDDSLNQDLYCYFIDLDVSGGVWFYAYPENIGNHSAEFFDEEDRFYLCYLDNSLATTGAYGTYCKIKADEGFLYDASIVYQTGELWYTDNEAQAVILIDKYSNILVSYSTTSDIKGITAAPDYGCYFIQSAGIFKLNHGGALVDSIYPEDVTSLSRIAVDLEDSNFLWVTDGTYVKKIRIVDAHTMLSIQLPYQATELQPMIGGVAVFCTDRQWRFIDNSPNIYKTLDPGTTKTFRKILSVDHENEVYNDQFPIASDTHWNNLSWKKVAADYYNLSQESYHQLRLTLRTNEDLYSPKLQAIYLQDAVKVENIYPSSYGNVYIKADISALTDDDAGSHEADLKVWWHIPV